MPYTDRFTSAKKTRYTKYWRMEGP